jgi:hypothetical protein
MKRHALSVKEKSPGVNPGRLMLDFLLQWFVVPPAGGIFSPINVTPMPDLHHHNNESCIINLIDDSIVAVTNPVIFHAGQFDATRRARILSE